MATLMERDVLLEFAAEAIAIVSMRIPNETSIDKLANDDFKFLIDLHIELSASKHDGLEFEKTIDLIKPIVKKYENEPLYKKNKCCS